MKKIKFYSFASALMLASAVGLGSCSSDSDATGGNPGVAGETVKTQFAINVPNSKTSRATAAETQGDGNNFLGMENIWLMEFNTPKLAPDATSTSTNITELGDIEAGISTSSSNKIYQNVSVTTGTNYFVLYGFGKVASKEVGTFDDKLNFDNNTRKSLSDVSFKLQSILASNEEAKRSISYTNDEAQEIINVLNYVDDQWPTKAGDTNLESMHTQFRKAKAGSATSVCGLLQEIVDYVVAQYAESNPLMAKGLKQAIDDCDGFSVSDKDKVTTTLTFPRNYNLPDGAVSLSFDEEKGFYYNDGSEIGNLKIQPNDITYPALLSYYANTPIYTNTQRVADNQWPNGTTNWKKESFTGWSTDNPRVDNTTAAIALANNITYGVSSLKLQVKCSGDKLSDNGDGTVEVPVPTDGIKVTGLLIGNQPNEVNYAFDPSSSDANAFAKTIWDSKVSLAAKNAEPSDANYTIVLPNNIEGTQQKDVLFAIEFENNTDQPFKGYDGVIEKGAKFYLVGTLKPSSQSGATYPSGITNPSVFMKGYQTTVVANIATLKNAYNCIPDIRTSNMQLGLSVDISWKEGIKYDITIGGDN